MSGQSLTLRKTLRASCEEVFDAWLDAHGMSEWMRPGPVTSCDVTLDPRVGGQFRIVMRGPGAEPGIESGAEIVSYGEFLVLDRPKKLQFTWISSRWENQETLITLELQPLGAQCELMLTHERFPLGHSTEQLANGWNQILEKLDESIRHTSAH